MTLHEMIIAEAEQAAEFFSSYEAQETSTLSDLLNNLDAELNEGELEEL